MTFWDVFGKIWRKALIKEIDILKREYAPDFIIANVENITSWRGPIEKHMNLIHDLPIDLFTSGDHIFDNEKNLTPYMMREDCKLIRPANYYESKYYSIVWDWHRLLEKEWKSLLVINLLSETFTRDHVYNPFLKVDELLEEYSAKNKKIDGIIIDFHKEVASEWYGMAQFLDSRVSFIYGTHTHIQTNDDIIFPWWTWLLSDVGMVWSRYSVIGSDYGSLQKRFLTGINKWKIEQSLGREYIVYWVCVDIDDETMKCQKIEKIKKIWFL